MRICLIYMSSYPWDVRVEKMADFLVQSGHEVSLLCRTTRGRPARETIKGVEIERLMVLEPAGYRVNRIFDLPIPINPCWYVKILGHCRRRQTDVIICRDIPLVLPSLAVGRALRIPVILDMAENYPAMFQDFIRDSRGWKKLARFVMKNPQIASGVERFALKRLAHVFVVIEESRERLIELGVPPGKISIVSNTPSLSKATTDRFDVPEGLRLIYIGQLQQSRGVAVAIKAFSIICRKRRDVHLFIGGKGEQELEFEALVERLGLGNSVHLLGWVEPEDTYRWINSCDVGIVPLQNTRQLAGTIANKLFDFMLCGKPVLVSDLPPMKRIVADHHCGWTFAAGDGADFAARVLEIADSSDLKTRGENGRAAVLQRYNWEHDCSVIAAALESVVRR